MFWAEIIVYTAFIYLACGSVFALWFVVFGVTKLDDSAKNTGIGFRFLILFGAIAFWLLLAKRLWTGEKRPLEKNEHDLEAEK